MKLNENLFECSEQKKSTPKSDAYKVWARLKENESIDLENLDEWAVRRACSEHIWTKDTFMHDLKEEFLKIDGTARYNTVRVMKAFYDNRVSEAHFVVTSGDGYDEYLYINGAWERVGSTDIDLSGYVLASEMHAITNTEITEIVNQVWS